MIKQKKVSQPPGTSHKITQVKNNNIYYLLPLIILPLAAIIVSSFFDKANETTKSSQKESIRQQYSSCGGPSKTQCAEGMSCELVGKDIDASGRCVIDTPSTVLPPTAYPGIIEIVQEDVASQFNTTTTFVPVKRVETARWYDTNFGCPPKGERYSGAFVPGYSVIVTYQDKEFTYHTGRSRHIVRCQ